MSNNIQKTNSLSGEQVHLCGWNTENVQSSHEG